MISKSQTGVQNWFLVCVGGFSVAISRLGMVRYGSKTG